MREVTPDIDVIPVTTDIRELEKKRQTYINELSLQTIQGDMNMIMKYIFDIENIEDRIETIKTVTNAPKRLKRNHSSM